MKIAYLGKIQLSDVDLSYLHEVQKLADITYVMEICPRFQKGPAFNIEHIYPKSGVFKAVDIYPDFQKYADFIDIDKLYVVNTCGRFWLLIPPARQLSSAGRAWQTACKTAKRQHV